MSMYIRSFVACLVLMSLASGATHAASVTVPNTFTANTPAVAGEVNANFDAMATGVNGNAGDIAALQSAVAALQAQVSSLQGTVSAQAGTISTLQSNLATVQNNTVLALDGKLGLVTDPATGQPTARFDAVNVQVVNGTDETESINGLGNLIIGYNEDAGTREFCSIGNWDNETDCQGHGYTWAADQRSGSHSLIVGNKNAYSRYGSLLVGILNIANGQFASVSGGAENMASGYTASVSGGYLNTASYSYAAVGGGYRNTASFLYAVVSGGADGVASGFSSTVSGGDNNTASGNRSSVSGGQDRTATGFYNWAAGTYSSND